MFRIDLTTSRGIPFTKVYDRYDDACKAYRRYKNSASTSIYKCNFNPHLNNPVEPYLKYILDLLKTSPIKFNISHRIDDLVIIQCPEGKTYKIERIR